MPSAGTRHGDSTGGFGQPSAAHSRRLGPPHPLLETLKGGRCRCRRRLRFRCLVELHTTIDRRDITDSTGIGCRPHASDFHRPYSRSPPNERRACHPSRAVYMGPRSPSSQPPSPADRRKDARDIRSVLAWVFSLAFGFSFWKHPKHLPSPSQMLNGLRQGHMLSNGINDAESPAKTQRII